MLSPLQAAVIFRCHHRPRASSIERFFLWQVPGFFGETDLYKQNIKKVVAKWHFWRQNCKIGKEYCDRAFNTNRKQLFFGIQSKSVDLIDSSYVLIVLILLYTCLDVMASSTDTYQPMQWDVYNYMNVCVYLHLLSLNHNNMT